MILGRIKQILRNSLLLLKIVPWILNGDAIVIKDDQSNCRAYVGNKIEPKRLKFLLFNILTN